MADTVTGKFPVDHVSIDVREGEIVCLFGLMGAGRTELMEALSGRDQLAGGQVLLDGRNMDGRSVAQRIEAGMGLVPEDRQRDGLVQMQSVGKNMSLAGLRYWVRNGFLTSRAESRSVKQQISGIGVKTQGPEAPITSLSGGNAQKVVIGKMLLTEPRVLLLDEPTRGVDVGAKGEIFALLFEQAKKGLAVLYVTSDVGEALTASHRILVMSRGKVVREFDPRTASREDVMAASEESTPEHLALSAPGAGEPAPGDSRTSTNGAQA